MNTTTRIQCPTCHRDIAVRTNGDLYTHGPVTARCPGRTETTDQELIDALDNTPGFVKLDSMEQLAEMWGMNDDDTTDTTDVPPNGYVACQEDDTHGWHVAEYSHQSQWGDHPIYTVVCSGYTDYYDITVVHDKPEGPVTGMFV